MYIILLICFVSQVYSANICSSHMCSCQYDNKNNQDYIGEIVDCTYSGSNVLETNYALPNTIHSLDLSSNNLTTIQPSILFKSKTMIELYLNKNIITEIETTAFELPELKRLDLSDNFLEFINRDTFKTVKNLEYLNLANNRFTSFLKLTFHPLSNLHEIVLDNNKLGPSLQEGNLFDRSGYGLTNKIQSLSISGIDFQVVPDNFFVEAYDIRKLIISNNNLSDVFELPFTLEYLDLSENPIHFVDEEDFFDLRGLKELKLNNLLIREIPQYIFEPLHSLVTLELERNKNLTLFSKLAFGNEVLEDADDFLLEKLSLKDSRISKLDKQLLVPFSQLMELDLQGNPWKCDCNLLWLKELQISEKYYDNLRCFTPLPLHNEKIFKLDAKYFACEASRHQTGITIAVVAFCVILTSIALWIFVFLPRYQSRCNGIREVYTPSTAYHILPMSPSLGQL